MCNTGITIQHYITIQQQANWRITQISEYVTRTMLTTVTLYQVQTVQ